MEETRSGFIKAIIPNRGFGFISDGNGTDYFFHRVGVIGIPFEELREGVQVEFIMVDGKKGPKAIGITLK